MVSFNPASGPSGPVNSDGEPGAHADAGGKTDAESDDHHCAPCAAPG